METSRYDHIEWENALAKQYLLEQGGSKAGAYAFLRDTQPALQKHLPKADYLPPGEDVETFLDRIDFSQPKIVRGCDALDVNGMVDVLDTWQEPRSYSFAPRKSLSDAERKEAIRKAIHDIRNSARHDVVRQFVEYESGKPFDGDIGVLVQDFCDYMPGSIIEHPHRKGMYRMADIGGAVFEELYDANGRQFSRTQHETSDRVGDVDTKAASAIKLYRKIQDAGLMPGHYSWQMEFGARHNDIRFYQARLFRPYEKPADFAIRDVLHSNAMTEKTRLHDVYGITPAEGLETMYRVPMYTGEVDVDLVEKYKNHPHVAYAFSGVNRQSTSLLSRPRNMAAFLTYQQYSLEHGYYRWAQKAPVTLLGMGAYDRKGRHVDHDSFFPENSADETRVKIFSNGVEGAIQFVE